MHFGLKVYAHVTSILPADWLKIVHHTLITANDTFVRALWAQSTRVEIKHECTLPKVHKQKRVISLLVYGAFYQSLFN